MQTGSFQLDSNSPSATQGGNLSTFASISFPAPFPEGSNVIVVPMVQTFNGCESPGVRIANVTTTGFQIRMNELVVYNTKAISNGPHTTETIGWVAYTV